MMTTEITTEFALRQLKRLDVLGPRRMSADASGEYLKAIKTAKTEDVAERVIEEFCQYGHKFPLPVELIRAIFNLQKRSHDHCDACGGTGYMVIEGAYKGTNRLIQQLYSDLPIHTTQPCQTCARGKTIQASLVASRATKMRSPKGTGRPVPQLQKFSDADKRSLFGDID